MPPLDRIEQALNLLADAAKQAGLTAEADYIVYLDVGGDALYDQGKKKYEPISGQFRTEHELVSLDSFRCP